MPQRTNLNVTPYFDDFNEDDNYYKVLFKPGFPIQARELNNLQSILQNQVEQFGDHFFKDGSVVIPGGISYDSQYYAVKVNSSFLGISVSSYIDNFKGKSIKGQSSQITANIINVVKESESETNDLTLYIKYLNSTTDGDFVGFQDGELLLAEETVTYGNTTVSEGSSFAQVIAQNSTSIGSAVSIADGVYFIRGFFARVTNQTIILDQYSNAPSYRVGLNIVETTVNSSEDSVLYDNARGFNNFSAPGADRFKFNLVLTKKLLDDTDDKTFIELLRLEDGRTEKAEKKTQYNLIKDYFAQRTFDESGNYTVRPFSLDVQESLNDEQGNDGVFDRTQTTRQGNLPSDDLAALIIGPGKAYVNGYDTEVVGTRVLDIEKPRSTKKVPTALVPLSLGNTLRVNNVFGTPAIGLNRDSTYTVKLSDRLKTSNTAITGTEIGEARVYSFGLSDAPYEDQSSLWDLRLFDIQVYTKLVLNEGIALSVGAYVKGRSSGASGYVVDAITNTNVRTVTLRQTAGTFVDGEQISINGNVENPRSIADIRVFTLDSVKSVYQDASTLGLQSDFAANVEQVAIIPPRFTGRDQLTINHAGVCSSPGRTFSGIQTGATIIYQNPEYADVVINRVTSVSSDKKTLNVATTNDVAGVSTGLLPTNTTDGITVPFRIGAADFRAGDSQGSLFIQLNNPNVASVDLSTANLPIYEQLTGKSTDAFGQMVINTSEFTGISSAVFETFDSERYSIHYSDGTIEPLTSSQVALNASGSQVTISGLSASESDVAVTATLKKRGFSSKIKTYNRSTKVTVDKSTNRAAGISTALQNGLDFNEFYGLRVEDEEISLNRPDVAKVIAVYESIDAAAPVLDKLTFEAGLGLDTESVLGEFITGPNNNALAQVVTRSNSTEVEVVYLNDERFSLGEQLTFAESGIVGTVQSILIGKYKDRTDQFTLDKGQRPDMYDYSRLIRDTTVSAPTKQLLVIYDHYTVPETDEGDAFTVLSYSEDRYSQDVPEINAPSGDGVFSSVIRATDTIDFRPRVGTFSGTTSSPFDAASRDFSLAGSTSALIPKPDESTVIGYDYYLPRSDRLVLTEKGNFRLVKGTPSENPAVPQVVEDSMTLAVLEYPPYLYNVDDVKVIQVDNKRFTMRDIADIETRLANLEEISSLSMLESETKSLQIRDAEGLSRFKTGFFADDFNTGNFLADGTTCFVDPGIRQLTVPTDRLSFTPQLAPALDVQGSSFNFDSDYNLLDANLRKTGNVVSLDYEEVEYVKQAFATRTENVNPFNIIDWVGTITLNPGTDTWTRNITDTNRRTIRRFRTVNTGRVVNNNTFSLGQPQNGRTTFGRTTSTRSAQTSTTRDRAVTNVSTNIDVNETADRFIRSRNVEIRAEGLKPFTRYYSFLDDSPRIDVVPKLIEVNNVSGSFRVGETIDGFVGNRRIITFRLCQPNHKNGPFNSPTTTLDVNPYDRDLSLANSTSYNSSSTFLNVDTASLALTQQGAFFGRIQSGMRFIGRTSNAQASLQRQRLITDSFGSLYASMFFRPENPRARNNSARFRTGTRTFKLNTSRTNSESLVGDLTHSEAEAAYTATGTIRRTTLTLTQTVLTTTRNDTTTTVTNNTQIRFQRLPAPQIITRNLITERIRIREPIIQVRNITNVVREIRTREVRTREVVREVRRRDPLAQTFVTDTKGAFMTSVDIYMATKDPKTPLTIEIRTVELGTPTLILASQDAQVVLQPGDVNTSDDASAATRVTFKSPIPLLPETEYAIVLLSPTSDRYTAWIAKLGERTVNTAELPGPESVLYSRQYGAGSLFKSQNGSTWTPSQFEDLKFVGNICRFLTDSGTATFYNPELVQDSNIIGNLPPNPIKSLPRKLAVGITTVTQQTMQDILVPGRQVGSGNTVTAFIENTGGPLSALSVHRVGTGYSNGTYNDVNFFSIDGQGSGGVGIVTIANNEISSVSITTPGHGYQIGETIGITTSDVTAGANAQISVRNISGIDKLFTTNVKGEQFKVEDPLVYYETSTAVSLASTTVTTSTLPDTIYSGNVIEILHPAHAMKDLNNVVELKDIEPTTTPTTISANVLANDNTISVANTSIFATFQGVTTSTGYAVVGNEVIYYNSIGSGTLGISTRGAEGTSASRHFVDDQIFPYEFQGIGLHQINKKHNIPNNPILQEHKDIDTYYLEIDRENRKTGDNQLNFSEEVVAGGFQAWGSRNLQFDRMTPRIDVVTPRETTVAARVRTVSGTSAGGNEAAFIDQGFNPVELNNTVIYPSPRMVASRINETENTSDLPRSKSFTIEVDLSTGDSRYSPFIYLDNCSIDIDRTRLNRPIDDYATDNRVNASNGDPHTGVYISQRVNLKNPATSLKVLTSAYVEDSSDMRVLYRLFTADGADVDPTYVLFPGFDNLKDTDDDGFGDEVIDPAKNSGRPDARVPASRFDEFRDYQFSVDDLPQFVGYQIKVVFSGSNESFAPRLNDIRTIALA